MVLILRTHDECPNDDTEACEALKAAAGIIKANDNEAHRAAAELNVTRCT